MAVGPCGGDGTRLSMPPLRHTIRVVYTRQAGSSVDLIADIGGTNARFAVVQGGLVQQRITLPTAGFGSAAQALAAVRDQTGMAARHIVLAVAGPVTGNSAVLTNGDWRCRRCSAMTCARWVGRSPPATVCAPSWVPAPVWVPPWRYRWRVTGWRCRERAGTR